MGEHVINNIIANNKYHVAILWAAYLPLAGMRKSESTEVTPVVE
jgi:hypothetical protein